MESLGKGSCLGGPHAVACVSFHGASLGKLYVVGLVVGYLFAIDHALELAVVGVAYCLVVARLLRQEPVLSSSYRVIQVLLD